MALNWNWTGYGMNAEQIAEARLIESATAVLGTGLPTPALVHAIIAEIIKGNIIANPSTIAPNNVTPEQFGAFKNGVSDPTVDMPAIQAAFTFLAALGGGTIQFSHLYGSDGTLLIQGDQYANIRCLGLNPNAGFVHTSDTALADSASKALIFFQGLNAYSLTNLRFEGLTFKCNSTSDYTRSIIIGNAKNIWFDRCRLLNNANEGIALSGQNGVANTFVTNCYAENIGQGTQKLSAYNLNSDTSLLANSIAINCGQGLEQDGRNFRCIGNHFENCAFAGALILSTWASWLDPFDGVTIHTSNNVIMIGNTFKNMATAISTGDSTGHLDHGIPVPGNAGAVLITGNTFIQCSQAFSAGADNFGMLTFRHNYMEDALSASTPCITIEKGNFIVESNTFVLGATSKWAYIVRAGDADPAHTLGTIRDNTIIGDAWTTSAFVVGPDVTLGNNNFDQVSATNLSFVYDAGSLLTTDGPLGFWQNNVDTWFVKDDPYRYLSPTVQSRMLVKGTPPSKGTWKIGDLVTNTLGTGVSSWRCTTPGTFDTIKAGVTISTTNGSAAFTATAGASKIRKYQWVNVAGVSGPLQIITYDPLAGGVGTFGSNADATVTSAAVTFAAGVWTALSTNDAAQLTITGQTTGDMLVATSGSAWGRKPIGTAGQYLAVVGGVPTYVTCFPRAANVNITANANVDFAANADTQQLSVSNSPVITVRSIPSGAYLILDVYNATGTANPTWAQSGMGSLITPGGSFPVLTPTINKHDRYAFYNNGTAVVMIVVYVNA